MFNILFIIEVVVMTYNGFSTKCVHSGEDELEYDVVPPIHLSSTFVIKEESQELIYSRLSNPTRNMLEKKVAELESGVASLAFSSGMAAIATVVMSFVSPGEKVLLSEDVYGGTSKLFKDILFQKGYRYQYVDTRNVDKVRKSISDDTKMIFIETPSNPMLRISNIRELSELAHKHGLRMVVDNTFASPYIQNPLRMGADIVVHSATKYLGGHSDLIAGVAVFKSLEDYEVVKLHRTRFGGVLSPFDSYLLLRGIKTLDVRMERHCRNAEKLSDFLYEHGKVKEVYYPFHPDFPQYDLARRQMRCGGGMITFRLSNESQEYIDGFLNRLRIIRKAVSLGGVESLITQPYLTTHGGLPDEYKQRLGITRGLIRFSVGIEDVDDLINDLDNALQ